MLMTSPLFQRLSRRGSGGMLKRRASNGKKYSKKTGGGNGDDQDAAPFVAWMNDVAAKPSLGAAAASGLVAACKGKQWSDLVPAMGMSGQPAEAVHKARAIWELYSSEACHLDTLEVLCHPFLSVLQQVQENATTDLRNRSRFLAAIHLRRLFSSVDALREVSVRFMRRLSAAMLLSQEAGEAGAAAAAAAAATAEQSQHAAVFAQCTQVSKLMEAIAALNSELLPAEMEYRLKHKASRVYLKHLADAEDPHFKAYTNWCEADPRCSRMSFGDLLAQPLQRLTRYPMLLRSIIKGADDPREQAELAACLESLEKAIDAHNQVIEAHESTAHLGRVEEQLVWPSLIESQPKDYVPRALREQFAARPTVSLKDQLHDLDTMAVRRGFTYEGLLHMIGKKKVAYKSVFAYLFGDVFLLASARHDAQMQSSTDPGTKGGGGRGSSADGKDSTAARMVEGKVHHISKIQVIDVPESGSLKNCFVMMFLDGFNNPYKFKTFQVASRYEKADWLRHLQARIDLCASAASSSSSAAAAAAMAAADGISMNSSFRSIDSSGSAGVGGSGRRTRMAPSRGPLSNTLRKTNSARDLRPASVEPAGFWGLDQLADGEGDAATAATPEQHKGLRTKQRARELPTPGGSDNYTSSTSGSSRSNGKSGFIARSRSLPKTPVDAFEWDDFCAAHTATPRASASPRKPPTTVEVSDYGSAWSVAPGVAVKVKNKTATRPQFSYRTQLQQQSGSVDNIRKVISTASAAAESPPSSTGHESPDLIRAHNRIPHSTPPQPATQWQQQHPSFGVISSTPNREVSQPSQPSQSTITYRGMQVRTIEQLIDHSSHPRKAAAGSATADTMGSTDSAEQNTWGNPAAAFEEPEEICMVSNATTPRTMVSNATTPRTHSGINRARISNPAADRQQKQHAGPRVHDDSGFASTPEHGGSSPSPGSGGGTGSRDGKSTATSREYRTRGRKFVGGPSPSPSLAPKPPSAGKPEGPRRYANGQVPKLPTLSRSQHQQRLMMVSHSKKQPSAIVSFSNDGPVSASSPVTGNYFGTETSTSTSTSNGASLSISPLARHTLHGGGKDMFAGMVDEALEMDDITFSIDNRSNSDSNANLTRGPSADAGPQTRPPVRSRDGYQYMVV